MVGKFIKHSEVLKTRQSALNRRSARIERSKVGFQILDRTVKDGAPDGEGERPNISDSTGNTEKHAASTGSPQISFDRDNKP